VSPSPPTQLASAEVPGAVRALTTGFDLAGVAANAILGGLKARQHRLDIIGFVALSVVSGLGGGIIVATLLQRGPPRALTDPRYLITTLAGTLAAYLLRIDGRLWKVTYAVIDAVALGCWATAGAEASLAAGLTCLAAVMLGTTQAVAGGVNRSVLLSEVPDIFCGNTTLLTRNFASVTRSSLDSSGEARMVSV
jgi:uncharacterized membrane protein YeiH